MGWTAISTSKKTPNKILGGRGKDSKGLEVISQLKCYLNGMPPRPLVRRNGDGKSVKWSPGLIVVLIPNFIWFLILSKTGFAPANFEAAGPRDLTSLRNGISPASGPGLARMLRTGTKGCDCIFFSKSPRGPRVGRSPTSSSRAQSKLCKSSGGLWWFLGFSFFMISLLVLHSWWFSAEKRLRKRPYFISSSHHCDFHMDVTLSPASEMPRWLTRGHPGAGRRSFSGFWRGGAGRGRGGAERIGPPASPAPPSGRRPPASGARPASRGWKVPVWKSPAVRGR